MHLCIFFVKDFSGTTGPMILKFGTTVGYDLYCVRESQASGWVGSNRDNLHKMSKCPVF